MSIQNFSFRLPSIQKIICSIPVILVTLYFLPPIGVILTIIRLFVFGTYHYHRVPAIILVVALLCLAPRGYELLQTNFSDNIPVFQPFIDFRAHPLYAKLTDYGRWTSVFAIIMLILSIALKRVVEAASSFFRSVNKASQTYSKDNDEYSKKLPRNGDEIKEKYNATSKKETVSEYDQTIPHVIKCPNCGKPNHVIGTVGKCKSCREVIEWQPKK